MRQHYLAVVMLLILAIATIGLAIWWQSRQLPPRTLTIHNQRFSITIARTTTDQARGLAGVQHLDPNQGMLFPLSQQSVAFWMKGMVMDIDILWIKDNTIVGINHSVPAPDPGTPEAQLPNYPSPVSDPQAVFEIGSGQARAQGISVGDKVRWNLE